MGGNRLRAGTACSKLASNGGVNRERRCAAVAITSQVIRRTLSTDTALVSTCQLTGF
jgi:hypothetical protein